MTRKALLDILKHIGFGILCLNALMIFIIPGVICRLIYDRN
jgi:hypothetical protein